MDLLEAMGTLLRQSELRPEKRSLLLAVSGGMDSMVLLDLLHRSGHAGGVAHFDHGLRGEEGMADLELVKEAAHSRELPFFPFQLSPPKSPPEKGIQHWAREERYRKLREIVLEHSFQGIATGHHADDRLETVLMGILRGSGYRGVVGVPTEKEGVIRPLIRFEKKELEQYAKERELPYREDPSNRSGRYLRNRIRQQVLPPLKEGFPEQSKALTRSMELLEEAGKALGELGERYRKELLKKGKRKDEYRIPLEPLKNSSHPRLLLFELLHPFGFPSERIGDLLEGMEGQAGARFPFGERLLIRDREELIITAPQKEKAPEGGWTLHPPEDDGGSGALMTVEERIEENPFPLPGHSDEALLDMDKLDLPLRLRSVHKGDRFRPLGMKEGSKTVLEHLTDRKFPVHEKEAALVLLGANGQVIWVVGGSIDDRYKVGEDTDRALRLRFPKEAE